MGIEPVWVTRRIPHVYFIVVPVAVNVAGELRYRNSEDFFLDNSISDYFPGCIVPYHSVAIASSNVVQFWGKVTSPEKL